MWDWDMGGTWTRFLFRPLPFLLLLLTVTNLAGETRSHAPDVDIFHGPASTLEGLLGAEVGIRKAVRDYVESLERRLEIAKSYLEDSSQIPKEKQQHLLPQAGTQSDLISDPLSVFKLIRRLASTLPNLEKALHQDEERKFLRSLENSRKGLPFPKTSDLNSATESILRVQDAYDLNVIHFAEGNFSGLLKNSSLPASDSFLIGSYALKAGVYTRAIEWLHRSYHKVKVQGDLSIPASQVLGKLRRAVEEHNVAFNSKKSRSLYLFDSELKLADFLQGNENEGTRRKKILDKSESKLYAREPSFMDLTNFAKLCRGEELQSSGNLSSLTCWNDPSFAPISPLKVELLHENPRVIQVHELLHEALMENIIDAVQGRGQISRSKVHQKGLKISVSASRTSGSTWLREESLLSHLRRKVYSKLESLVGLTFRDPEGLEDFQVANYRTGGHYNPHLDNILTDEIAPTLDRTELDKGDRISTIMFYLSDVEAGGMTAFPRLGIAGKPVKGSALIWHNLGADGTADPLTLHGGCPILYGSKWIGNQWVRSTSQIFSRKCDLKL